MGKQAQTTSTATNKQQEGFSRVLGLLKSHRAADSSDLSRVISGKGKTGFDQITYNLGEAMGVDFDLLCTLPQKQIKRAMQFINAIGRKSFADWDYTHARILCAMHLSEQFDLTYDALGALAAGVISKDANTRGITRDNVNQLFARKHSLTTVMTKISNSVGENGFMQALGMTFAEPGKRNRTVALNREHPMVIAFFNALNNATTGQIQEMIDAGTKGDE